MSTEINGPVLYRQEDNIAVITLNRPERRNAISDDLVYALADAMDRVAGEETVRAVVLNGNGAGFCAGADMENFLKGVTPKEGRDYIVRMYQPLWEKFLALPKPIIGAINGVAAGAGASLALACDLRIMADDASILYAFINIGLGPDAGGSWFLARQVGYSRAFEIAIEGKRVSADRCLELGLANRVVPSDMLQDSAMKWARHLAVRPTLAIGITKHDMQKAMLADLSETIAFEAEQQMKAFASHDLQEGVQAFLQKRKANFKGK